MRSSSGAHRMFNCENRTNTSRDVPSTLHTPSNMDPPRFPADNIPSLCQFAVPTPSQSPSRQPPASIPPNQAPVTNEDHVVSDTVPRPNANQGRETTIVAPRQAPSGAQVITSPTPTLPTSRQRGRGGRGAASASTSRGRIRRASGSTNGGSSGRRRGRGRANARGGQGRRRDDPTQGWTIGSEGCKAIEMENDFIGKLVEERARLFCSSAVRNLEVESSVRGISPTRAGIVVLLLDGVLRQLGQWLNEFIRHKQLNRSEITLADMYSYVAIMLLSHAFRLCFERTIQLLAELGNIPPSLERIRFIAGNVKAYSPTGRGEEGAMQWFAQRDRTRHLSEFETLAFRETKKVFFSPLQLLATLDDELHGTRAVDNQVKTLSDRKADREGHSADLVADALFRIVFAQRYRRRGEPQVDSVRKLLTGLFDGRGEESLSSCIVTADRGYGKEAFMKLLSEFGVGSVFVMSDQLLRAHPFLAASYLNPSRADEEENEPGNDMMEESAGGGDAATPATVANAQRTEVAGDQDATSVPQNASTADVASEQVYDLDRRREFVIDDKPSLGPESFFATKFAGATGRRVGQSRMAAVAVRERGNQTFCKVLRFMYTVPRSIQDALNTWIAVVKPSIDLTSALFYKSRRVSEEYQALKKVVEAAMETKCDTLSIGQRCADWFVLRQFRITGTNAGTVLLANAGVRRTLGLGETTGVERSLQQWFDLFFAGWFSSKVSTEAMMRGSANEEPVMCAIRSKLYVRDVFDVGMVASKQDGYLACSPDGIALLNKSSFPDWNVDVEGAVETGEDSYVLATVEIKTRVAATSLGESSALSTSELILCDVGDDKFRKYIPREHMGQLMHQLVVLGFGLALYVCAAETGIIYVVLVRCSSNVRLTFRTVLTTTASPILQWAHTDDRVIPAFVKEEHKNIIETKLHFWKVVNEHVAENGPFVPLKLFKHAAQSFYSKTKGGVDGASEMRANLRSPSSHFQWEQKLVSQTIKTVAINAFIGWRIYERRGLLETSDMFGSLDSFRNQLNNVQATNSFMLDLSKELLSYAATLTLSNAPQQLVDVEDGHNQQPSNIPKEEVRRLVRLAHDRKNKRLVFFNAADGLLLRIAVQGHEPRQGKALYCALCGQNPPPKRGHRSSYSCSLCGTTLCIRIHPGLRRSCWSLWHSNKELKLRVTPEIPTSTRRTTESSCTGGSSRASLQQAFSGVGPINDAQQAIEGASLGANRASSAGSGLVAGGNDGVEEEEPVRRPTRASVVGSSVAADHALQLTAERAATASRRRSKRPRGAGADAQGVPILRKRRKRK